MVGGSVQWTNYRLNGDHRSGRCSVCGKAAHEITLFGCVALQAYGCGCSVRFGYPSSDLFTPDAVRLPYVRRD